MGKMCPLTGIVSQHLAHPPSPCSAAAAVPSCGTHGTRMPLEQSHKSRATGTEQDCLQQSSMLSGEQGRRKGRLQPQARHRGGCIVLNQDNEALPQPLSYGNPNRLLSSPCTRGSAAPGDGTTHVRQQWGERRGAWAVEPPSPHCRHRAVKQVHSPP